MDNMVMASIHLDHSTLDKNSMLETEEILWTVFVWTVPDYSKLQENVIYFQIKKAHMNTWVFCLTKMEEEILVTLRTSSIKQFLNFSIVSSNGTRPLNQGQTTNTDIEKFVARFSRIALSDPENGYLNDDTLIVQCKYIERQADSRICVYPSEENEQRADLIKFQNDWREMYLRSRFSDFKIIVAENEFYTHKFILAARSMHFHNMFSSDSLEKDKKQMTFRASPHVFHEVLMYMYTGDLVEMSTRVMLEVLDIAYRLRIDSLILRCQKIFCRTLEVDNVKYIYKMANSCGNEYLKNACTHFMNNNCSFMLEELGIDGGQ